MSLFSFEGPSAYPPNVEIIKQTFQEVTFQWKELACPEQNGPITGYLYRVYYDHINFDEGRVDKNTATVTLLYKRMKTFSVAAANEVGIGQYSPPLLVPSVRKGTGNVCVKFS